MVFISIKKKTLGLVVLAIIVCLVMVSIYGFVRVSHNENKYESMISMAMMFEDTHFLAFLSQDKKNDDSLNIEVFDIGKGKVISSTPLILDIQNEVFNYVKSVKDLYTKVIPFPEKGYVISVPFDKPMNVRIKLLNEVGIKTLHTVFIILSEKEAPVLLVLDSRQRPYFFTFTSGIQPLLDYVKLSPEEMKTGEQTDEQTNEQSNPEVAP